MLETFFAVIIIIAGVLLLGFALKLAFSLAFFLIGLLVLGGLLWLAWQGLRTVFALLG